MNIIVIIVIVIVILCLLCCLYINRDKLKLSGGVKFHIVTDLDPELPYCIMLKSYDGDYPRYDSKRDTNAVIGTSVIFGKDSSMYNYLNDHINDIIDYDIWDNKDHNDIDKYRILVKFNNYNIGEKYTSIIIRVLIIYGDEYVDHFDTEYMSEFEEFKTQDAIATANDKKNYYAIGCSKCRHNCCSMQISKEIKGTFKEALESFKDVTLYTLKVIKD